MNKQIDQVADQNLGFDPDSDQRPDPQLGLKLSEMSKAKVLWSGKEKVAKRRKYEQLQS